MKSTWRQGLDSGNVVVVLRRFPSLSRTFPTFFGHQFAKTDEARQLVEVGIHSPSIFARPFVLPPGTPKDKGAHSRAPRLSRP